MKSVAMNAPLTHDHTGSDRIIFMHLQLHVAMSFYNPNCNLDSRRSSQDVLHWMSPSFNPTVYDPEQKVDQQSQNHTALYTQGK